GSLPQVAAREDDPGARARELARGDQPQAAVGAGDDGDPSLLRRHVRRGPLVAHAREGIGGALTLALRPMSAPAAAGAASGPPIHWYHVLELPGGEVTPGEYDLRPIAARVPMPASLPGLRCLDVGTRDGFW